MALVVARVDIDLLRGVSGIEGLRLLDAALGISRTTRVKIPERSTTQNVADCSTSR